MRLVGYSLLILLLPTLTYAVYWTQFRPDQTSPVPWGFILFVGLILCEATIYLVVVRTHDIRKLGLGGRPQHTPH